MLILIVSNNRTFRQGHVESSLHEAGDLIVYDDTQGSVADLEQYLYPSLFTITPPVVVVKFILTGASDVPTALLLKGMVASPTIFIFEEMEVGAPVVNIFKKAGAIIHSEKNPPRTKKDSSIFGVTACITAPDKKSRWRAYRQALDTHPIEAIIGIMYWKLRDLATKSAKERTRYLAIYRKLLDAHARAWQTGAPLDLLIEKILLTQ